MPAAPKTKLVLVALAATGLMLLQDPGRSRGLTAAHPLPGALEVAGRLHAAGRPGPAGLLDEMLVWVTPRELGAEELARRADGRPEPRDGAELETWEGELAEALRGLSPLERTLLWGLTLEPGYPAELRPRIMRLLDRGRPDPARLRQALAFGERATAWEAAIRLGRLGRAADAPALREAVRQWRGWGRQYAILGLVLLGDEEGAEEVREAAADASPAVRRHVALALAELGDLRDLPRMDALARRQPDPATLRAVLTAKQRLLERHRPLP